MAGEGIIGATEALGLDGALVALGASDAKGTERASRAPRVLAMLTTMRRIQVRSDERPSKRSMPLRTPSQASWTTSSATARVFT